MLSRKRLFIAVFLLCLTAGVLFVPEMIDPARAEAVQSGGLDLIAEGLEVTQGVQNLNNSVRLAAGKATFVRFYVRSNGTNAVTTARLIITRGANSVTLFPSNPGGEVNVLASPARKYLNQSFYFQIPEAYTTPGTFAMAAEVNPAPHNVNETNYDNNILQIPSGALQFENVPNLDLVIYNIGYRLNGQEVYSPDKDLTQMVEWMYAALPIGGITFKIRKESIRPMLDSDRPPNCEEVNNFLLAKRTIDLQTPGSDVRTATRYYGMVQEHGPGDFMRGCANDLPGHASSGPTGVPTEGIAGNWDIDGSYGDWYGSHEILHNLNRYHAEFCSASDGRPFPNPNGRISPVLTGINAIFGFDLRNRAIYPPTSADNMSYCDNQWMSDFTSNAVMDFLQQNQLVELQERFTAGPPQDSFLVQGTIFPTASAQNKLEPLFFLDNATDVTNPQPGNYAIVLRNAANTVLVRHAFQPSEVMEEGTQSSPSGPEQLGINELVPFVENVTRIEIENPSNQVIKSITAGANNPTVVAPFVGPITPGQPVSLTWTALDLDLDALTFLVEYSDDNGATWRIVSPYLKGANVGGGPVFSTMIDTFELTAGPQSKFRVLASDGIHTGSADSGIFAVPNNPPTVEIEEPGDDTTITFGEAVTLRADAYDIDEGVPPANEMQWTSSIDGGLGNGSELAVSHLSLGEHTITFTVNDGDGGIVTDAITVEVTEDRVRQSRNDFDGDGETDVAVFRPSNGTWYVTGSDDGDIRAYRWGLAGDIPVQADYDNDGTTDISVFRPSNGTWYIRESSSNSARFEQWGFNGDIPVPADYDGDTKIDIAVYRPSEGIWYIRASENNKFLAFKWGVDGDVPVPADYDGDTLVDIAVYRPGNNVWYIFSSSQGTFRAQQFGLPGDVAAVEDYDGDGEADITIFRPSDGNWWTLQSNDNAQTARRWGTNGDKPVAGDYDGDGVGDLVVFRPSDGFWYILQSSNGTVRYVRFGLSTDAPV